MLGSGIFVDANLLILLVVGLTDRAMILKHKRLRKFTPDHFDLLVRFLGRYTAIFVTPNILTEASNLLSQHREPQRSRIMGTLSDLITKSKEVHVTSAKASQHKHFRRLGLTDAALLECISAKQPLLTVDLDLYSSALKEDDESCLNFWHFLHIDSL